MSLYNINDKRMLLINHIILECSLIYISGSSPSTFDTYEVCFLFLKLGNYSRTDE